METEELATSSTTCKRFSTIIRYERAPMSLDIALYTIFKKRMNFITPGLTIDHGAEPDDCIIYTTVMSTRIRVSMVRPVMCLVATSNKLVSVPKYGSPFIFGLRYTKTRLVKVEEEYVARNWGKESYDLKTLKSEIKNI